MKLQMNVLIFILVLNTSLAKAQDLLLDTLQGKAPTPEKSAPTQPVAPAPQTNMFRLQVVDMTKLTDPFQKHMFAQFEIAEQVPYDVQQWANQVLLGNYAAASHLWSVIEPQVPQKLQHVAKAGFLYSLWKLKIYQTFFGRWTKLLNDPDYSKSNAEANLEGIIGTSFDQWLIENSIVLNPAQENTIAALDAKTPLVTSLKAWMALRKGEKAEEILNIVPQNSPLRYALAETVALAHARKNDLVGVARILKTHIQPIIEKQKDPKILTQYYLTIGRLLYQAGNLPAAKEYYEKVPATSPQYLQAREELAWVLLRQGNIPQLRGEMRALGSSLFDETFSPDIYVVRAISNLKMCFYDSVEKDFQKFGVNNQKWAKQIDGAISATIAPAPPQLDNSSRFAVESIAKLTAEKARLDELSHESIGAALPAVGIQKHWKEAEEDLQSTLELAKKNQDQEFRRQWKNQKTILSEAIRKMRFIKVEFMTEVRQLSSGEIDKSSLVADQGKVVPVTSLQKDPKEIIFPLEIEPWPDELFKMRSTAQSKCLKNGGTK